MRESNTIPLLGDCQIIKDALLEDLDALQADPSRLASYLQRPDRNDIYTRGCLLDDDLEPDCAGRSIAYRLWQFSRILHKLLVEHRCENGGRCMSDAEARPWYTYVVLNTIPYGHTFEVGVHLFHSFGIADLERAGKWYEFLRKQQGRALDQTQTFIISNLIYRDWREGRLSRETIFRFSRIGLSSSVPESESCIDIVVRDPEGSDPLKISRPERYEWFMGHFERWTKRAYRAAVPAFPGLIDYLQNITSAMGIGDDEEWSLYAFPLPSFGPGQPKSGLYIRSPLGGICDRALRGTSFLLASTLWPLDYIQRQRLEDERRLEREEGRRALVALTQDALAKVKRRLEEVEATKFERGPERSRIRAFFQGLDELSRYGSDPGSATLPMLRDFAYTVKERFGVSSVEPFSGVLAAWEGDGGNDSIRHFLKADDKRSALFCREIFDVCQALLDFYRGALVTGDLAGALSSAVSLLVSYEALGKTFAYPLLLFDGDFMEDRGRLKSFLLGNSAKTSRPIELELDLRRWGVDICLVAYLLDVLFADRSVRMPEPGPVRVKTAEPSRWEILWRTSAPDKHVGIEEIAFDSAEALTASKLRNRMNFLAHIFCLPGDVSSLDVVDGEAVLRLDLRHLTLLATPA